MNPEIFTDKIPGIDFPGWENITDAQNKILDGNVFGDSIPAHLVVIGCGLMFAMVIFTLSASCSAGHSSGDVVAKGVFRDNSARVMVSLFWGVGGGASVTTLVTSCMAGNAAIFGGTFGASAIFFAIVYCVYFQHQSSAGGLSKTVKNVAVSGICVGIALISIGASVHVPTLWGLGIALFAVTLCFFFGKKFGLLCSC